MLSFNKFRTKENTSTFHLPRGDIYFPAVWTFGNGQGQSVVASRAIASAIVSGSWVLLQNCHLGLDYMETMEDYLQVCLNAISRSSLFMSITAGLTFYCTTCRCWPWSEFVGKTHDSRRGACSFTRPLSALAFDEISLTSAGTGFLFSSTTFARAKRGSDTGYLPTSNNMLTSDRSPKPNSCSITEDHSK